MACAAIAASAGTGAAPALSGNVHARQLRRVSKREEARRYPRCGHQRIRDPARLLRLGCPGRSDARGNGRDGVGVQAPSARRRGRAQGSSATEDRRIRRFAVRRAANGRATGRSGQVRSARRRARHLRRPQLHPLGAAPDEAGLCQRARTLRARARVAALRIGVRFLRADGYRRRSLLPDRRNARVGARSRSRSTSSSAIRPGRTSRRSMR